MAIMLVCGMIIGFCGMLFVNLFTPDFHHIGDVFVSTFMDD